jgi:hypothetical protein
MANDKFPSILQVAMDPNDDNDPPELLAFRKVEEAVDADGPTLVATYKLISTHMYRKDTVECSGDPDGAS